MTWTDADHAWAAGFFDGEGSIVFSKCRYRGRPYRRLEVRVAQTGVYGTPPSLLRLRQMYGGGVWEVAVKEGCRPAWRWIAVQGHAAGFLLAVRPFLVEKDTQAVIGLTGYVNRSGVHEGGVPDRYLAELRADRNCTPAELELAAINDATRRPKAMTV